MPWLWQDPIARQTRLGPRRAKLQLDSVQLGDLQPDDMQPGNIDLESQERRTMRRFDMRLPAIVRLAGTIEFHTETQNVSARGVFFYLDRAMPAGTRLEVILTFPPHITLTDPVRVRFMARVIRVEHPLPSLRVGTAAMIEEYEFLRSPGTADFLGALQKEWKMAT